MRTAALACLLLGIVGCDRSGGDEVALEPPAGARVDPAAELFDESALHEVRLTLAPADWDALLGEAKANTYFRARFQWKDLALDDVGLTADGGSSRFPGNQKMPMRLKFDAFIPGQRFLGFSEIKLDGLYDDSSLIRERLCYPLFRKRLAAPRWMHCRLAVNGAYRGLYALEELFNESFLRQGFGSVAGPFYDMENTRFDPYQWQGPDPGLYTPQPWIPLTPATGADPGPLLRFLEGIDRDPAALGSFVDLETLIDYFAVEAAITDVHGFAGDFLANNHGQYRRPETGLFHIIPRDLASTWGGDQGDPERDLFENFSRSRLSAIVQETPALRARLKARVAEIIESDTRPDEIVRRIDFIYAQIRDAAYADVHKAYPNFHFDWEMDHIKEFAARRYASLKAQVATP